MSGDELSAAELARTRVASPVRVREVLQGLIEAGALLDFGDDRYLLTAECAPIARSTLVADWALELQTAVSRLVNAGCSKSEISAHLEALIRSLEGNDE